MTPSRCIRILAESCNEVLKILASILGTVEVHFKQTTMLRIASLRMFWWKTGIDLPGSSRMGVSFADVQTHHHKIIPPGLPKSSHIVRRLAILWTKVGENIQRSAQHASIATKRGILTSSVFRRS